VIQYGLDCLGTVFLPKFIQVKQVRKYQGGAYTNRRYRDPAVQRVLLGISEMRLR